MSTEMTFIFFLVGFVLGMIIQYNIDKENGK